MEDKERELIFEVAGMAGDILLRSGAEISRVDETMRRIACAYELENVSTFVLSNGIFLTSETEGSNHQVRVRHIPLAGARLDRIDAVNELSREIELGFFTPTEAKAKLKEIEKLPQKPGWHQILAAGIGSGAFCFLFGGDVLDSLAAFLAGFILDLYVLDSVNEFQKKRYQSDKITVPVSTNLSWMDFYDETIMNWLEKKCADASMPSGLCRMEITETSYAAIEADRNATLEALREAGILLLLDDFGSGYSSFGMLQNYNFDIMKIDMSFVRQIETNTKTRSIIRFIIEMAHTMNIKIIAEGAETKEQVEFLRDNGCDYIQGYYFYKPMPEEEFVKLLDAGR